MIISIISSHVEKIFIRIRIFCYRLFSSIFLDYESYNQSLSLFVNIITEYSRYQTQLNSTEVRVLVITRILTSNSFFLAATVKSHKGEITLHYQIIFIGHGFSLEVEEGN